jgi:DNA-binding GntR family transcriptional regulator
VPAKPDSTSATPAEGGQRAGGSFVTPTSIEASVYEHLRREILAGRFRPGARLGLVDLADELGTSTMPVRAAIARLNTEGLAHKLRSRGSIVAPLEIEDFEEIQAIRAGIEAFAARLGVERIDDDGIASMRRLLERLEAASATEQLDEYLDLEWEFHAVCYAAARRERLLELVHDYRRRAERYLRLAVPTSPGFGRSLEVQRRLLECAETHDGVCAEQLYRDALAWTTAEVAQILAPT